jgi:hypothetical protein
MGSFQTSAAYLLRRWLPDFLGTIGVVLSLILLFAISAGKRDAL